VVSFRDLFVAPGDKLVSDVMVSDIISAPASLDQEAVAKIMAQHDLNALPVVDAEGRMHGIVTIDDIVDVVQSAATEDIQKLGGMEALDTPVHADHHAGDDQEARGLVGRAVLGRNAHGQRHEPLRRRDRQGGRAGAVRSADHLERGQLGSQATTLIIRAMALAKWRSRTGGASAARADCGASRSA